MTSKSCELSTLSPPKKLQPPKRFNPRSVRGFRQSASGRKWSWDSPVDNGVARTKRAKQKAESVVRIPAARIELLQENGSAPGQAGYCPRVLARGLEDCAKAQLKEVMRRSH